MKQYFVFIIILISNELLFSHCQVPCGIYNDALRIVMIKEDFNTINKAMTEIIQLSKKQDSLAYNQINRWIDTKDEHASNIQSVISDYFLTQRIKESNKHYVDQIKNLHQILIIAMKCKQSTNLDNVRTGLDFVDDFSNIYFDDHGFNHLKKMIK